ncbi:MAG TPA: hypothetical protein VK973_11100, partial [Arenicellales bacterium]|nr:hypothetical protein [Arenicellales bacterium]
IPAATMAAVGVYAVWAGPYTEVPADAWWHIGHINDWLTDELPGGHLGSYGSLQEAFDKSSQHWHAIAAYLLHVSGMQITDALGWLSIANTLLLSAAVYSFGLLVFRDLAASHATRHAVAAAAVLFFVTQFGISVFAYIRYYSFAPTLPAYIVYLAALGCFIEFTRHTENGYRYLAVAVALTVAAAALHMQEALFMVVLSGLIVLWEYVRIARRLGAAWGVRPAAYTGEARPRIAALLAFFLLAYVSVHGLAYVLLDRHNPLNHGVMADIHNYVPFLQNLYILQPTYQFYQVVTAWGVLVYVLFAFSIRRFSSSSYLVAGMALPFVTVFNPVFTDFFLRFSWPEVLWRVCYALPLPFVGGYLLVRFLSQAVQGGRFGARVAGLVAVVAMTGLLLPIHSTFVTSPHSKIYTLAPVGPGNDHRLWADLFAFLRDRESRGLITDPVTGYLARSLTGHRYPGYKFFGQGAFPVNQDRYQTQDFAGRNGWLVVINRRDGAASAAGRYGRHWPEEVMKVSQRYSGAFTDYVTGHPEQFTKVWSRDGISVYRVEAS